MPLPSPPPAPLYPPNSPEIQAALAALARIRELSADCDARPNSQAAARDFRRGLVEAIDALTQPEGLKLPDSIRKKLILKTRD